jgi:hypothetical protein
MFSAEILVHLGRGIAWVAENFPDDPRLGKRLLLVGAALIGAFWFLAHSLRWMDSTFILQVLSLFAGIICIVLGLFVFFRRAVWRNQEKRGAGLLSLDLNRPRNYLAPDYVLENESTNVFLEPAPDED